MYGMVYRICLALVSVPLSGGLREALGAESNWLVDNCAIFFSEDLEQNGSNCMLAGITSNYPRKVVSGEEKLSCLLDTLLEPVEIGLVVKIPLGSVPREFVMSRLVKLR